MKSFSGSRRACQLRVDGRYGFEYLLAAVVRTAVQDQDWEWVDTCGKDLCELIGIDPSLFLNKAEEMRGRAM